MKTESLFEPSIDDLEAVREIASQYGLVAGRFEKHPSGYKVQTNKGPKWVKRFYSSEEELQFIREFTGHLRRSGFRNVPEIHPTIGGGPFARFGGAIYYMTDWVEGRPVDFGHIYELAVSAQTLARMHLAAASFPAVKVPPKRRQLGSWLDKFDSRLRDLHRFRDNSEGKASPVDRKFRRHADDFIRSAENSLRSLRNSPYRKLTAARHAALVNHRGYSGGSLLFDGGNVTVVDFDLAAFDLRLEDVARFIAASCDWSLERALFALANYHAVYPLTDAEMSSLSPYFLFPLNAWFAGNLRYRAGQKRVPILDRCIREAAVQEKFAAKFAELTVNDLTKMPVVADYGNRYGRDWKDADRPEGSKAASETGNSASENVRGEKYLNNNDSVYGPLMSGDPGKPIPVDREELEIAGGYEIPVSGLKMPPDSKGAHGEVEAHEDDGREKEAGTAKVSEGQSDEMLVMMDHLLQASKELENMISQAEEFAEKAGELGKMQGKWVHEGDGPPESHPAFRGGHDVFVREMHQKASVKEEPPSAEREAASENQLTEELGSGEQEAARQKQWTKEPWGELPTESKVTQGISIHEKPPEKPREEPLMKPTKKPEKKVTEKKAPDEGQPKEPVFADKETLTGGAPAKSEKAAQSESATQQKAGGHIVWKPFPEPINRRRRR